MVRLDLDMPGIGGSLQCRVQELQEQAESRRWLQRISPSIRPRRRASHATHQTTWAQVQVHASASTSEGPNPTLSEQPCLGANVVCTATRCVKEGLVDGSSGHATWPSQGIPRQAHPQQGTCSSRKSAPQRAPPRSPANRSAHEPHGCRASRTPPDPPGLRRQPCHRADSRGTQFCFLMHLRARQDSWPQPRLDRLSGAMFR